MAVRRSSKALVLINIVALRRTRLILGWVTVRGFESRSLYLDSEDYSEDGDQRRPEKGLYFLRQVSHDLQLPVPTATGVQQV